MKVPPEGIRIPEGIELESLLRMLYATEEEMASLLEELHRLLEQLPESR